MVPGRAGERDRTGKDTRLFTDAVPWFAQLGIIPTCAKVDR